MFLPATRPSTRPQRIEKMGSLLITVKDFEEPVEPANFEPTEEWMNEIDLAEQARILKEISSPAWLQKVNVAKQQRMLDSFNKKKPQKSKSYWDNISDGEEQASTSNNWPSDSKKDTENLPKVDMDQKQQNIQKPSSDFYQDVSDDWDKISDEEVTQQSNSKKNSEDDHATTSSADMQRTGSQPSTSRVNLDEPFDPGMPSSSRSGWQDPDDDWRLDADNLTEQIKQLEKFSAMNKRR